jgi:transposase InsO family protein
VSASPDSLDYLQASTLRIVEIHGSHRGVYGSPRIHAEPRMAHGDRVGRKRVERLMREAKISGMVRRKAARRSR